MYPTFSNYLLLTSTAQAQEDSESITLSEYSIDDAGDVPPEEDSLWGNRYNRANDPRRRDPETDTTDPQIDADADDSDEWDVPEHSLQVWSPLKPIAIVTWDKCREILQNA